MARRIAGTPIDGRDPRAGTTRRRALSASLVLGVFLAVTSAASAAQVSISDRIDEFVRDEIERQKLPGVAIAIVKDGVEFKAQGYGLANLEHQVPVGPATIFQSGSIGKQFTAALVMLLVEDGKLSLSDPLTRFFPDAPPGWGSITVRHLLTHTSGIPDYTEDQIDYRKDYTEDELAGLAYAMKLEFPAGARWNYSNTGYVLLGIIVHKVSGAFYGDGLATCVFKPLGMKTARVISETAIVPNRAAGYDLNNGELENQAWVSPALNTTADGSLYLSLRDMIAWDAGVRARAVLKPESWERILTPVQLNSGRTYPYGFAWSLDERGGQPLQQHDGAWQGFTSQYSRFIGDDLSIIIFANGSHANPVRIADGIAALMNPRLAVPDLKPVEDRDPQVTAKLRRLLDDARAGTLTASEFAYVRAGFFPEVAEEIRKQLETLGPTTEMVLVKKTEKGDDRIFTYEVSFGEEVRYYTAGLAPDGRLSRFGLRETDR
jgi:CubicO group peptidase (beta-lactamase class C family)